MCETHDIYGFQKDVADGGMAEYMRFSERAIIHKIPESLSEEDAALIEPMACAIHTVRRGDIDLDDVVVIAGAYRWVCAWCRSRILRRRKSWW